jgi:DNA-3-methyladenine glycosylase
MRTEGSVLPRDFYLRPTLDVARDLLGKVFVRRLGAETFSGRIVEVEAYHQEGDEASHSHRGPTPRNEAMFREGGCLYVYFTYGMHYCMNVVTEAAGVGAAVLIRAMEPVSGIAAMQRNRGGRGLRELCNGPANCCQAFAVGRDNNGAPLGGPEFRILDAPRISETSVLYSRRIGIRKSVELEWRMVVTE